MNEQALQELRERCLDKAISLYLKDKCGKENLLKTANYFFGYIKDGIKDVPKK